MLMVFLIMPGVLSAGDPDIIDVLYLCRSSAWDSRLDLMLIADPSIDVLGVQTLGAYAIWQGSVNPAAVNRRMRIYMPRNYDQLVAERDMLILDDAPHSHPLQPEIQLDPKWLHWWVDAVKEDGMALCMWGGDASWGGHGEQDNPSWSETVLDEVLPFTGLPAYAVTVPTPLRRDFADTNHPLARLPWDICPPIMVLNNVKPKPGATMVAYATSRRESHPWIAWWEQGQGRVLGETEVFGSLGGGSRMPEEWEWYQDFLIYLTYFAARKEIPQDIYKAHRIREDINTHIAQASLMVSLLEFIERFGVSTTDLYTELDSITLLKEEAEEHYRRDEYDQADGTLREVNAAWGRLNNRAIEVKDRALIWIYLIEWMIVTSAAIIAGVVVWTLMVRRRLYHEILTTRSTR